jgi:radical SAM protein with 4Fe4S-binding SPASM domain
MQTFTGSLDLSPYQHQWNEKPLVVIWELTRACALACRHCRAAAVHRRDPAELSTKESEQLIEQIVRAGPRILILSGGDPILRRDLTHLIGYATRRGLHVALSPSATPRFLNTELESLVRAGLKRASVSLDGPSSTSHDAFRGVTGAWNWAIAAVDKCRRAGLEVQINTTFTRQNFDELDGFTEVLDWIRPATWTAFQLVPTGRGKKEDLLTGEELEDLFERLYDLQQVTPYEIKTTEGQHHRRVALQQWRMNGGRKPALTNVNDGKGLVFISHTGEICPSGFLPFVAGNVRTDELLDVYRSAPVFRELREPDRLKGKCGCCEFRYLCGGSRARAYSMTGDYLAQEPLCIYRPGIGRDALPRVRVSQLQESVGTRSRASAFRN